MGKQETDKWAVAEAFGHGMIQERLAKLAKRYQLWIVAGTIPIRSQDQKVYSSSLVYDDEGRCAARYDKIHLFDVSVSATESHQESATILPGKDLVVVDTPIGRLGLTVCYDVRFPELYRQLQQKGAEIFTVPSAFTAVTGLAHWEVLLRARAIENLCFVLAANQGGTHVNGRKTYGHSMIVDPWGNILGYQEEGAGLVVSSIDLEYQQRLRQTFPCNEHHVLNKRIK